MPQSIFILKRTNVLYIADSGESDRILMIPLDQQPIIGTIVANLESRPGQIYVDDDEDGPTIYVPLPWPNRVEKWTRGASSIIQQGEECLGVSVDNEKNVYMSSPYRHYIFKWSPKTNTTTIVAGEIDQTGWADHFLRNPVGVHVDRMTGSVYVADSFNHRIQKWVKNATKGITVAGSRSGLSGDHPAALLNPYDIFVDDEAQIIYVVDRRNHRIQRWLPGATAGDTIAGKSRLDNDDGFAYPQDLAFDKEGNLYVCDSGNNRVQMFALIDNPPCPITSTTDAEMLSTSTTTPIKSRAISSHWHPYNKETIIIATFSIILWLIKMQL